jgi:hypothetical protein
MRVAGAILYGLMRRVRSSRELEEATRERLDFRWFLEGRTVDHSTFADFRVKFSRELKGLFRQIARRVCEQHEGAVLELVIDGTRLRANSSRYGARTAEGLERLIGACVEELNRKLQCLEQTDREPTEPPEELERLRGEVTRLRAQLAQYQGALEKAHIRDEAKRLNGGSRKKRAAQIPVTDPDSTILPNKEGGFAPNYTPTVAVDAATGAILSADVVDAADEIAFVLPALAEAESVSGITLTRVLADGNFASGETLDQLEAREVEAYMPTETDFSNSNPANRPDPTQPVAQEQRASLPRRGKQLARSAFIYDAQADEYRCPMGKPLTRVWEGKNPRTAIVCAQYRCPGKAGCPLGAQCVKGDSSARVVSRDVYQSLREKVGRRMATEEGRRIYRSRAPVVEGAFARIKNGMQIRRFLLRGAGKVRAEWHWICTAYNLKGLVGSKTPAQIPPKMAKGLQQILKNSLNAALRGIRWLFMSKDVNRPVWTTT